MIGYFLWALVYVFITAGIVGCIFLLVGPGFQHRSLILRGAAIVAALILASLEISLVVNYQHTKTIQKQRDDHAYYCTHGLTTYCQGG